MSCVQYIYMYICLVGVGKRGQLKVTTSTHHTQLSVHAESVQQARP